MEVQQEIEPKEMLNFKQELLSNDFPPTKVKIEDVENLQSSQIEFVKESKEDLKEVPHNFLTAVQLPDFKEEPTEITGLENSSLYSKTGISNFLCNEYSGNTVCIKQEAIVKAESLNSEFHVKSEDLNLFDKPSSSKHTKTNLEVFKKKRKCLVCQQNYDGVEKHNSVLKFNQMCNIPLSPSTSQINTLEHHCSCEYLESPSPPPLNEAELLLQDANNQEESEEINVENNIQTSRVRDDTELEARRKQTSRRKQPRPKDFCFFCKNLVLNFARHVERSHFQETDVQKILIKPKNSKERKHLLGILRKKGNYVNYKANFKPVKTPNLPYPQDHFLPCEFCLGLYVKKQLWRHKKLCPEKPKVGDAKKSQFSLRPNIDINLQCKVFPKMRLDSVTIAAKEDPLICAYGAKYLENHKGSYFVTVISSKMRQLAKVLLAVKKLEPSIQTLFDALKPKFYNHLVTATKIIAKYDPGKDVFESPSVAMNISTSIKQCCDVAIIYASKSEDIDPIEAESELKTMIDLFEENWKFNISATTSHNLIKQKRKKITIVSLANDLKLLEAYLSQTAEEAAAKLTLNMTDRQSFKILLETVFCRVITLNRQRQDKLQRLLVDNYVNSNKNNEYSSDNVLPSEKILMERFKLIILSGNVPVLFSPDVEEHIKIILGVRKNFIVESNKYIFANTNGFRKPLNGYTIMSYYADLCGAKNPKALISIRLRDHVSTLSQLFSMSQNDFKQLTSFIGIHCNFSHDVYQTAKISKILLSMGKYPEEKYRGMSLDAITVDMETDLCYEEKNNREGNDNDKGEMEEDMQNEVESDLEPHLSTSNTTKEILDINKNKKIIQRIPWTQKQKDIVKKFFKVHIKTKTPPKERECNQLKDQNPLLLDNKDWKKIKVFVQNLYTKY